MHRNIHTGCLLVLAVQALNGQVSPSVSGAEVHGYVSATFSTARGPLEIALPAIRVSLRPAAGGATAPSGSVVTDERGHFQIAAPRPGKYRLCADSKNFQPACSGEDIDISGYSLYLNSSLNLKPVARATFGRISLKDGSPAARSAPSLYTTAGAAQVTIVDHSGKTVAGPVHASIFGYYVLAGIPSQPGLKVRVQYETATATSLLSPSLGRLDLEVPDTPPIIESLTATVGGRPVTQVPPGTVVKVVIAAKDADQDSLHYKWQASSGGLTSRDSPSISWKLPASSTTNRLFVEVSDRKGGVGRTYTTVSTSIAPVPVAAIVAPLNPHLPNHLLLSTLPQAKALLPTHAGPFIDAQEPMHCTEDETFCEAEAKKYYQAIGVFDAQGNSTAMLGSLSAWRHAFGFSADPLHPVPDEIQTVYFNNGDLQLGRDMHCREIPQPPGAPTEIACYVTNFINTVKPGENPNPQLSIGLAAQNAKPFATVAMTFTAGASSSVNFFVFNGDGTPLTTAILDSQGAKAVPGVCISCHGGEYDSSSNTTSGSSFLPFDTSSFIFGDSEDVNLSEANQREKFRKMNNIVQKTNPAQPIQALIAGWYACGVGNPGCAPDATFVPGGAACPPSSAPDFPTCGWSQASVPSVNVDPKQFYLTVLKPYCRTCHVAQAPSFNVQNFTDFRSRASGVEFAVCQNLHMPDAEVPFNGFWKNSTAQDGLSGLLAAITGVPAPCLY